MMGRAPAVFVQKKKKENADIALEERLKLVAEVVEEDEEFIDMIELSALLPC
jgi:hypothetical protein